MSDQQGSSSKVRSFNVVILALSAAVALTALYMTGIIGSGAVGSDRAAGSQAAHDLADRYRLAFLASLESEAGTADISGKFHAFFSQQGGIAAAVADLDAAAEDAADKQRYADARQALGLGNAAPAIAIFTELRDMHMAAGESANVAASLAAANIGALTFYEDIETSLGAYKEAVLLDQTSAEHYTWLGHILRWDRQYDLAVTMYEQALTMADAASDPVLAARAVENLGHIYVRRGEPQKAVDHYMRALEREKELGQQDREADLYLVLGKLHVGGQSWEQGVAYFSRAATLNEELGRKKELMQAYSQLGQFRQEAGAREHAVQDLTIALALAEELEMRTQAADIANDLGGLSWDAGDLDGAAQRFARALTLNEELGRKNDMATGHSNLGLVYEEQGNSEEFCEQYSLAQALYEEMELADQAAEYAQLIDQSDCRWPP